MGYSNDLFHEVKYLNYLSNINACYEAAVIASLKPDFISKVILKDDYRDRGPNRVLSVMFWYKQSFWREYFFLIISV